MMYVFKQGNSSIRYKGDGYYSASMAGWFGPSDYTIYGAYTLVQNQFDGFQEWAEHVENKLNNPDIPVSEQVKMTKSELTHTDTFWMAGGNAAYYYITGKRGQQSFFDVQFEDIYYEHGDYIGDKIRTQFFAVIDTEQITDDYISDTMELLYDDVSNIDEIVRGDSMQNVAHYLYDHESMATLYKITNQVLEDNPQEYPADSLTEFMRLYPDAYTEAIKINHIKDLKNYQNRHYAKVPEIDNFIQDKIDSLRAAI